MSVIQGPLLYQFSKDRGRGLHSHGKVMEIVANVGVDPLFVFTNPLFSSLTYFSKRPVNSNGKVMQFRVNPCSSAHSGILKNSSLNCSFRDTPKQFP